MCKQGIEMGLGSEMENLRVMSVVYVGKDTKELSIDMLRCGRKGWRELLA
jgi:hypothetical protein